MDKTHIPDLISLMAFRSSCCSSINIWLSVLCLFSFICYFITLFVVTRQGASSYVVLFRLCCDPPILAVWLMHAARICTLIWYFKCLISSDQNEKRKPKGQSMIDSQGQKTHTENREQQPRKTDKTQILMNNTDLQWNGGELCCFVSVSSSCLLQYTCPVIHGHVR